jgi:hypothetical protein
MEILSIEHQIILYECVVEAAKINEFNSFNMVFYCGTRLKWSTPNALLIVIEDDPNNRFYADMSCEGGSRGTAYCSDLADFKKYHFYFKIITQTVYDALNGNWNRLADESWIYPGNMKYIPGIDITETIQRYHNLRIFL